MFDYNDLILLSDYERKTNQKTEVTIQEFKKILGNDPYGYQTVQYLTPEPLDIRGTSVALTSIPRNAIIEYVGARLSNKPATATGGTTRLLIGSLTEPKFILGVIPDLTRNSSFETVWPRYEYNPVLNIKLYPVNDSNVQTGTITYGYAMVSIIYRIPNQLPRFEPPD